MNSFAITKQDTAIMKGMAISAMLCHHLYAFPPETVDAYHGILLWIGILGKVCVDLFLFCSGYGLAANYKPISVLEDIKFVAKRLVKFYANYWVIFLIFVPITIFIFNRPLSAAYGEHVNILKRLIYDLLGLQGFHSYNITWWFNKLIILLYLLFPAIYRTVKYKPWLAILVGIVLVQISSNMPYNPVDVWLWQLPFVLGIGWKLNEDKLPRVSTWLSEHKKIYVIGSLLALISMVLVRMFPIIPCWIDICEDGFIACTVALCTVSVIRHLSYISYVFAFLGTHSINIYLTHTFINGYWHPEWLHRCEYMRGGQFCSSHDN